MATYLTQEGYDKKMAELAELEAQRPAIKNAIAEARDKGDLSENAEYDAAKEAQRLQAQHRGGAASQQGYDQEHGQRHDHDLYDSNRKRSRSP